MRRLLFLSAAALLAAGCSDSTPPKVPTSVSISPGSVTLDAVGATRVVHATVNDQNGNAMSGQALSWASSSAAVTVLGLGGDSARVTSAASGSATVTAQAGGATGTAQVQVAQVAKTLEKASPDFLSGAPGAPLATQLRVIVRDRLGAPIAGQTVTFTVTSGGGSVSSASVVTGADGAASTTLTLGASPGSNTVTVSVAGGSAGSVVFTATGTSGATTTIDISAGGFQAAMEGDTVPVRPSVVVRSASGTPIAGVAVNFAVTSGGGSVTGASTTTNAAGVASVTGWKLGPSADLNTLTATAAGVSGSVVFRGAGCTGSGPAFEITVCITTAMTTAQREVFRSAAARWSTVIKGDLGDVTGELDENDCGTSPSANQRYDDVLIFAAVANIDGPGQVLGQAGPCYIRNVSRLPIIGVMRFDAADLNALENSGLLSSVILHEMGHVLGIGSLWKLFQLLQNESTTSLQNDTYFAGAGAIAGFDAIGGTTYTGGQKVPVENSGGAGTMNAHWRESVLKNELMTGFLNAGSNPMSLVTVRSLADMGYTVDTSAADSFFLTLSIRAQRNGEDEKVRMHDDLYEGPVYTLSPRGTRTRIR